MQLPFLKALVAVVSSAVIAVGAALSAPVGDAHQPDGSHTTSQTTTLKADGLQFLGQLVAGDVKPDLALKKSWMGDVTAGTPTAVLRDFREDLGRAERDQAISPTAASALLSALSTALGKS